MVLYRILKSDCRIALEDYVSCVALRSRSKNIFLPFKFPAISREETDDNLAGHGRNSSSTGKSHQFNGYNSEEYLDRLEPNGNIPSDKSAYNKRKFYLFSKRSSVH